MSQAFQEKWKRTSANKRLLDMLLLLAKKTNPLIFDVDELESLASGGTLIQHFENNKLYVRYCQDGAQMFVAQPTEATERREESWTATGGVTPTRLAELENPDKRRVGSSLDDATAAAMELAVASGSRSQREAAARRSQPLPIVHPQHQPEQ